VADWGPVRWRERAWVPCCATRTERQRAWEPDFRSGAASLENAHQRSLSLSLSFSLLFSPSLSPSQPRSPAFLSFLLVFVTQTSTRPNALIGCPPWGKKMRDRDRDRGARSVRAPNASLADARRTSSGFLPLAGSTKVGLIEPRDTISTTVDLDRRSASVCSLRIRARARAHTIYVVHIFISIFRTLTRQGLTRRRS